MRRTICFVLLSLATAVSLGAQTLGTPEKPATPGTARDAAEQATTTSGTNWLPQADISFAGTSQGFGDGSSQVNLEALDLFFSPNFRMYFSTALKFRGRTSGEVLESPETPPTPGSELKLTEPVISSLIDPFGGLMNVTAGYYHGFWHPRVGGAVDSLHGLFADVRAGFRFIDLPDQSVTATRFQGAAMTPFYSGLVGMRFSHDLFLDGKQTQRAGGFEAGGGLVLNRAFDDTNSGLFAAGLLETTTTNLAGWVVISVTDDLALQLTFEPWSSNERIPKRFTIGTKLMNPSE